MADHAKDLAVAVAANWEYFDSDSVGGCPPTDILIELLDVAYVASTIPDEGRFSAFNIVVSEACPLLVYLPPRAVRFTHPRTVNSHELCKLAPAVDVHKSALWIEWTSSQARSEDPATYDPVLSLIGLVDMGTRWSRARAALCYKPEAPTTLLVQVDGPGRLTVYRGYYVVASLANGQVHPGKAGDVPQGLHPVANHGMRALSASTIPPKRDPRGEWLQFQFGALWNTYAALANLISARGHGGTVVLIPDDAATAAQSVHLKYGIDSWILRDAFLAFINARHALSDAEASLEAGEDDGILNVALAEAETVEHDETLVEATRFVAHLAGCDGAVVLSSDLRLLACGAELRATARPEVFEVFDASEMWNRKMALDHQGMRHRSAIAFVGQHSACAALVVSQDGPVSIIWNDGNGAVKFQRTRHPLSLIVPS